MTAIEPTTSVALNLFERQVKQALRLYDQPERLGRETSLASPYVLARALRDLPRPVTERARGDVLCAEIRAAARLWRGPLPATRDEMLDAITDVRRDPDDPYMVAYAQRALGQAHLAAADQIAAEQHIRSALALFRQIDIPGEIAATEQLLADLDARQSAGRRETCSS